MNKNNHRRLEINLKMTSKVGITIFTIFGAVFYLLIFLGLVFTAPKPMTLWKILVGGIGGVLGVGVFIVAMLHFFRSFLIKHK